MKAMNGGASVPASPSQARVDRLAFQGEQGKDAFVDAARRLALDEALQGLDTQRKFPRGQRTLVAQTALAQPVEVLRQRVVRTVDDAQVLAAPTLQGRLHL